MMYIYIYIYIYILDTCLFDIYIISDPGISICQSSASTKHPVPLHIISTSMLVNFVLMCSNITLNHSVRAAIVLRNDLPQHDMYFSLM